MTAAWRTATRYVDDAAGLDCDKPGFPMYCDTPEGKGLAGLTFYTDMPTARDPQIGGPRFIDRPKGAFTSSAYLPDEEIALLMEPRTVPPLRIAESLGLRP